MRIYLCSVCGYDYNEAEGDPGRGIAPGTKWEDLPADWACPICGADKDMFSQQGGEEAKPAAAPAPAAPAAAQQDSKRQAVLCSNLAKAASKQHNQALSGLFAQLAEHFEAASQPAGSLEAAAGLLKEDLKTGYAQAFAAARQAGDRGASRALTWGEKVTMIQSNLLGRYLKEGEAAFSDSQFFVCEACGFIFVGDQAPALCPVCKVPSFKFVAIKKGA